MGYGPIADPRTAVVIPPTVKLSDPIAPVTVPVNAGFAAPYARLALLMITVSAHLPLP